MNRLREFGCHIITSQHTIDEILRLAILADKLSYDHVRIGDHVIVPNAEVSYPNAQTLLAAFGVLTKHVRISTAVTDCYRRHPVEIAQAIATLDVLTHGRAVLGIGAGEMMNLSPFGIEWTKPVKRLREAVEVINLLLASTPKSPATYEGEIFSLKKAYLQIKPVQKPRPPIYIGAAGCKTRELVGMVGDGWLPVGVESPQTLKKHLLDVKNGAERTSRQISNIDIDVTVYTAVDEDIENAYRVVSPAVKSMLVQQREVLRELTGLEVPENLSLQRIDPTDKERLMSFEEMVKQVPRSAVEDVAAFGPIDSVIGKLEEFLGAGATSLTICIIGLDHEKTLRTYAEKIIPYLKETYGSH
ncbi:N5,N10-methylenetetrahydromethanopterin reductase [Candidatus Caldarchaeum subterraneum]|uniref:N5,N10-methylenetetrahydromethanopterin reductase n=1 Tax=Caldiarchaeum subterraneum TaxID=311458 RepID=E6N3R1_CALS0|nr:N5,N10-methylenetetrahydromethanopterin reductase [Candidatus Caldarchaeum subterraneum]BAJ47714.1 N5,N10-methylenetetrahydromethanopterin reductase [Candidatus Caldarchaeum subterraneum]BAJ50530.1 N5,N10-methylenetetrahydromethanopterin reductase [Candidatus Caldarchaeum subterraneum]